MTRIFDRTKLFFLVVFAVAVAAIWGYQAIYVWPAQKCVRQGRWWAPKQHVCGTPVSISTLTGRPNPVKAAPAPKAP